jgi:hypothetical protein
MTSPLRTRDGMRLRGILKSGQEHLLAHAVGPPVQGVHGSVTEQRVQHRTGKSRPALHMPLVIDEPHRFRVLEGDGVLSHDPGAHYRAGRTAPTVRKPGVPLGEEGGRAVDERRAKPVHGRRVPADLARKRGVTERPPGLQA